MEKLKKRSRKAQKRGVKNPLAYLLSYAHSGATMTKEISEEKKNIFPLFWVARLGHIYNLKNLHYILIILIILHFKKPKKKLFNKLREKYIK